MKHYSDIIYSPVITERSMLERQNNVYIFKVAKSAIYKAINTRQPIYDKYFFYKIRMWWYNGID